MASNGTALLGDAGKFASAGYKRIPHIADLGGNVTEVGITVSSGTEAGVTLYGSAPAAPMASAILGSVGAVQYDATTHLFRFVASPDSTTASATVHITGS